MWGTIEFPVPPLQEAEDQMRKWNIKFQQELTHVFDTETVTKSYFINTETSF